MQAAKAPGIVVRGLHGLATVLPASPSLIARETCVGSSAPLCRGCLSLPWSWVATKKIPRTARRLLPRRGSRERERQREEGLEMPPTPPPPPPPSGGS